MFTAAIFDMDGLLIDSERSLMQAWLSAASDAGRAIAESAYVQCIGLAAAQSSAQLTQLLGDAATFSAVRSQVVARLGTDHFPAKAGALALLGELRRRGVPCGVATSSTIAEARERLHAVGLAPFFHSMSGGDEVPHGKPDPAVYLLAAQRLGVPPAQCMAFEDSANGIKAAHAAGLRVVAVPDLARPDTSACLMELASLEHAMPHVDTWFPGTTTR